MSLIQLVTTLEYFDFIAFSLFYNQIPFAQSGSTFLQLTVGYAGRLLGSIFIGTFTHRFGAHKILLISIFSMSLSTILIALLPNSPASLYWLYALRTVQGVAFAIEFPTASLMAGKQVGLAISGATLGYILAALLFNTGVSWRVPFLCSGFVGLVLSRMRLKHMSNLGPEWLGKAANIAIAGVALCTLIQACGWKIWHALFFEPTLWVWPFYMSEALRLCAWVGILLPSLPIIKMPIVVYRLVLFGCYLFLITQSLMLSMTQAKLVSANPNWASANFYSLLFALILSIIPFHKITALFPVLFRFALLLIGTLPANNMITMAGDITTLLLYNQLRLTVFIILGLMAGSSLFEKMPAIAPIAYNSLALLASILLQTSPYLPQCLGIAYHLPVTV